VLKLRFELFAAASLALHAGVFAATLVHALVHGREVPAAEAGAAGGTPGAGAAAAVPGETFDVPDLEQTAEPSPAGAEGAPIELDGPTAPPAEANTNAEATATSRSKRHARSEAPSPPGGAAVSEPPPLYGAVGDRAAGDLVTSFKRVFPIAASTDPLWDHVPVGFYAEGDVTFFLAEDGSLTHATASAAAASAFRSAVLRTTTLLKHRLFTARGATTHLHMVLRVSDHLVNHGAFTIDAAGSFELPSGRHVSVTVLEK
jgi:hypothetical protein